MSFLASSVFLRHSASSLSSSSCVEVAELGWEEAELGEAAELGEETEYDAVEAEEGEVEFAADEEA